MDGQVLGALQLALCVGIDLSKGSQGGRRELISDSKVLCFISSSGNCHEMSSYGFGDLTLISLSIDLDAKLCPVLYCQITVLVSIVFLKTFCTQEENGATAFPNISIFIKTSFLQFPFHACFSLYSLICYSLAER